MTEGRAGTPDPDGPAGAGAGAQTRVPDPRADLPPTSTACHGLSAKGPFLFSFFYFFLKQSYLFTLISCLKNINKITQQTKAGIHAARARRRPRHEISQHMKP